MVSHCQLLCSFIYLFLKKLMAIQSGTVQRLYTAKLVFSVLSKSIVHIAIQNTIFLLVNLIIYVE